MGELNFNTATGEIFATQFFSSRKLKFILFLEKTPVLSDGVEGLESVLSKSGGGGGGESDVLNHWRNISESYKGKALFSFMVKNAVPDVLDYFSVDVSKDLPMIVAHDPTRDHKFKSRAKAMPLTLSSLHEFVAGVLSGAVKRELKSEPLPKQGKATGPVVKAVGNDVIELVSQEDRDVLLEVYAPWCAHCKKLMPTYDILARAVQAEPRIVIAKIDGTANDLPAHWAVKGYPALLWFPAKDKPYSDLKGPNARPYWDAGHNLHELVSFVQRQSSFPAQSLKIATAEQLGSLLGDEEILRAKYEDEEKAQRRNDGRDIYENEMVDYVVGEVVFDGKRWHIGAASLLALYALCATLYVMALTDSSKTKLVKKKQI
jgi:thiol-disulfide isomerase/thioredoxin